MKDFQIITITPPVSLDPAIAIAGSRAGELGVLNLEYVRDAESAGSAIEKMARYARQGCGIKIDSDSPDFARLITADLPASVEVVILTPWNAPALPDLVAYFHERALTVLLEVTSLEQALLGRQLGVEGLIAKGHEAAGWVGEETTFILLQRLLSNVNLPVWAFGGIGLHTAAACYAAGAAGIVLDYQLALTRESQLSAEVKAAIAAMDGSETLCLGADLGQSHRLYTRPALPGVEKLSELAIELTREGRSRDEIVHVWRQAVAAHVGWNAAQGQVWPLGQDAAFAAPLGGRHRTVGGVLQAIHEAVDTHISQAQALRSLDEHSPLAQSHGTRYPVVQGPMTRVSDRAEFALKVAEEGALPFLALALMRAPDVEKLLEETQSLLGGRSWGVGILGFVPLDLRQEQLEVIRRYKPPFALIAGGRPDQARTLEKDGTATYLHVPSPGLLRLFLQDGARRFIFEGRECGGHVGPRSSFVLWNTMIDVLLEELPAGNEADCHILFAGGIHDAMSAAMVAAMAAPLAERGVRLGVLLGTSYLFTQEAVTTGAITAAFQAEAIRCQNTVLLESGPGHATRCAPTPFVDVFGREKLRLQQEKRSSQDIRYALEELNIGRLRIASKGITRHPHYGQDPSAPKYVTVGEEEQRQEGMYMIGQLAALRDRACTMAELHFQVSVEGARRLQALAAAQPAPIAGPQSQPSQIAIVGISAILPKAPTLRNFWDNVLNRVYAITEVPKERWDSDLYFDPSRDARDKIYSKWGGFIDDVLFDPLEFGIPPNSLSSIDPMHLLALVAARDALRDADYSNRPFDRSRTSVILGASGGVGDLGQAYVLRSGLPMLFGEQGFDMAAQVDGFLPDWTEDSFAGLLLNVAAGRIANRFDFGGLNYVVDAACASSLTAVHLAVKELETGNTDVVIAGGVDTVQSPFGYLCFSKTQALSPSGQPRVFDAKGDGIVISEGVVMLVLKRLADAERDGDRIYAVIEAVAGSSDGRAMGLTAPRPEGQVLAMQRAYAKAGISPTTVGLFEAHGTGTVVGDRTEALSLTHFLESEGAKPHSHAVGSVKSMIGHTKATAGVAALAKIALSLYHKTLPPTLGVTKPNAKARFGEGPLYVNSETRPWIQGVQDHPRRAGVSAFGFGGTNFHAVVEEYTDDYLAGQREAASQQWPTELLLWSASSRQELLAAIEALEQALAGGARPQLRSLAYSLWQAVQGRFDSGDLRLAIVASSLADLQQKLAMVRSSLGKPDNLQIHDPRGIYLTEQPLAGEGRIAFLFPGQGSMYPNMLRELAIHFPEVREVFERTDRALADRFPQPLSSYIFPPPAFTPEEERQQLNELTETNVAQSALGAASMALFRLLADLGVHPDLMAGHSYGEYAALCAAGAFDLDTLARLSEARGRSIIEAAKDDLGTMAAVRADVKTIAPILEGVENVWIANLNSPQQTVISGTKEGIAEAVKHLEYQGISARPITVACAFHSPLVAPAQKRLAQVLLDTEFATPAVQIYSNTTAGPYPQEPQAIRELLVEHLVRPTLFVDEIEAMYAAGARVFVEVGPRNVLTALTGQILSGQPLVTAVADMPGRHGLTQLQHTLAQLAAHGVNVRLDRLFQGREVERLNLNALAEETQEKPLPPTMWLVNGSRARPAHGPEEKPMRPPMESALLGANGRGDHPIPLTRSADRSNAAPPSPPPGSGASPQPTPAPQAAYPGQRPAPAAPVQQAAAAAPPPAGDEAGQVMMQFQHLMGRFLDTQKNVMLAYLQGAAAPSAPAQWMQPQAAPAPQPRELAAPAALVEPPPTPSAVAPQAAEATGAEEAAVEPAEAEELLDKEQLTHQLLQIVSERTGYPPEMLDLDVDIEAKLGIDSIKRVEILGALQRDWFPPQRQIGQAVMDQLTSIKTLRGIVDSLDESLHGAADGNGQEEPPPVALAESPQVAAVQEATNGADAEVPRSTLLVVDAPPLTRALPSLPAERVFLITDDGQGVAQAVAEQISRQGGQAVLVQWGQEMVADQGVYQANLADPAAAAELVATIRRQQGPIGGLIHLLPLQDRTDFEALDLPAWRDRLSREVKSFFHLIKMVGDDLKRAGELAEAWVVAATAMGGVFAIDAAEQHAFSPSHGGLAGLAKTLSQEWPMVHCKVIDLDLENPTATLAKQVLAEMAADDKLVEVGYRGQQRHSLQTKLAPLNQFGSASLEIDSDWVVLVTGGARGITAEVALELAERYQPTLLLAGSSAPAVPEEPAHTAGLSSPQELKTALMDRMRQQGEEIAFSKVETAYNRLLKEREMRRNLEAMRRAGSTVHYYQADVRDEQAMTALIEGVYRQHGRLDGVVHGAGVIEDKLIEDKTPESFDRVFDTKADSAFILSRLLRPDSLKFLALFSSAAGTFGNRGQSDYAATNEVVNKLAIYLDRRWPGRVVSLNWGPWLKTGMVSDEVRRQFAKRGVQLISIPAGRRILDRELRFGQKGEVAVIIAGGTWGAPTANGGTATRLAFPLLYGTKPPQATGSRIEVARTLDPSHDLYLLDHQLDGKPVLPMAVAMEMMIEVVQQSWSDLHAIGLKDLQVLRGVVLDSGPKTVQVVARAHTDPPYERLGANVAVEIIDPADPDRPYYRATVELDSRPPQPPVRPLLPNGMKPFPLSVEQAYRQWLFHGPLFQGITEIKGISAEGMVAICRPSSPQQCLAGAPGGQWMIDPVVFDSGLQLIILWSRAQHDMTPLPSRFQRYRLFAPLNEPVIRCHLQASATPDGHVVHANLSFFGVDNRLLGALEDLECNSSKALNRLVGKWASR